MSVIGAKVRYSLDGAEHTGEVYEDYNLDDDHEFDEEYIEYRVVELIRAYRTGFRGEEWAQQLAHGWEQRVEVIGWENITEDADDHADAYPDLPHDMSVAGRW